MSEFLGSRISLISKSDIRYVGVLHEINSDESTVSLENVRSFGTEGRKSRPEEEVGPSDQVYEYIVFRGSDVKDLRIEEHPGIKENKPPTMPDDPAIVGATRSRPGPQGPNQNGAPPPGQGPGQGPFGHQPFPPNNYYGPPGQWGRGGPGGPMPPPGGFGNMPYPPPPGWFPPGQGFPPGPGGPGPWGNQPFPPGHGPQGGPEAQNQRGPPSSQPQDAKPAPIGPGADRSKSGTPSQPVPPTEPKSLAQPAPPSSNAPAPTPPVESKPSTDEVKAVAANLAEESNKTTEVTKPPPSGPKGNRVNPVLPLSGPKQTFQPPIIQEKMSKASVQTTVTGGPNSVQDATSAARAAVAVAMAQLGNSSGNAMDNLTNKVNEMRVNAVRGGPAPRAGRGRGGRPAQGKVEVPDSDFDFAQSNAKFNKGDIVKEAIAGSPLTETPNGNSPSIAPETPASSDVPVAYNKSRSFFDNISSEAKDRAENQGPRAGGREWRDEEQRRNMETFGQGSVDGGHRNSRGRGRGRGRGGRGRGFSRGGRGGNRGQFQTPVADQ